MHHVHQRRRLGRGHSGIPADEQTGDDDSEEDELVELEPEMCDPNLPELPDDEDKNYPRQNNWYFRAKRYVRADKFRRAGFMALARVDFRADEDHDQENITFPEIVRIVCGHH